MKLEVRLSLSLFAIDLQSRFYYFWQGFEDVLVLDELLHDPEGNSKIEACLEKYSTERSRDAQAICELAMYNYLEMRELVNKRGYYLRRLADWSLHKLMGKSWVPLYSAVTFSRMPYAECVQHRKWQDEVREKVTH